ncbi:MAG: DNA polymerase III subunit delta' [SAR202 cluster bacterium]|nr:DNA polymerase III subunit delta' [SAR202 cluster bacterium]MDP6714303.1 DNA polymerase III subunit delta' [SAR202 cluster bacterium]
MWKTVGHDKAVHALSQALTDNRMSHAFLITGSSRVGKMSLAMDMARALNCVGDVPPCGVCGQCRRVTDDLHPDVRVIGLEMDSDTGRLRTVISIEQVRDVQRDVSLKPYEGRHRVVIFDGVEKLREEAANSLLKTLEEPPDQVVIILLASNAGDVLPTILSRCRRIDLRPIGAEIIADHLYRLYTTDRQLAEEVARLSGGRMGWAIQATQEPEMLQAISDRLDTVEQTVSSNLEGRFEYAEQLARRFTQGRAEVLEELDLWLGWWRDVMVISEGKPELVWNVSRSAALKSTAEALRTSQAAATVKAVQRAIDLLQRNVNPRLVIEELMLELPNVVITQA